MKKLVLDVGNCAIDHSAIERMIRDRFQAEVLRATEFDEAMELLRGRGADLVLVNRRLHGDHREGVELVRQIKSDPATASTPVMLVSDLKTYQESAVEIGAEPGFGKSELSSRETVRKLERFLG
jgi:CheY-like chemotaxis protein